MPNHHPAVFTVPLTVERMHSRIPVSTNGIWEKFDFKALDAELLALISMHSSREARALIRSVSEGTFSVLLSRLL
jgi:hypothetical protein